MIGAIKMENSQNYFTICPKCYGLGKKNFKFRKQSKLRYEKALEEFEKNIREENPSPRPKIAQYLCDNCAGSGLIPSLTKNEADVKNFPHVAIIGAGIGGVALAVACLHRSIPFTLYERDISFDARAQGYGLTLQQASNSIKGLGLFSLKGGMHSTHHLVHNTQGERLSEWGMKTHAKLNKPPKRINVHIPRQSLRQALLDQLGDENKVQWGHQLISFTQSCDQQIELCFETNGKKTHVKADLLVGADGIYSTVRRGLIGEAATPLEYIGYMVILGICSLEAIKGPKSPLLNSETVFQTVNGHERIYMMPFSEDSVMWQLSFPICEKEAKALNAAGFDKLKEEACRRANWHHPIPEILSSTLPSTVSGYPVYDRKLLLPQQLERVGSVTLIGDAAHPMTPFKGQGANQALLDALCLARGISVGCNLSSKWKERGLRGAVLKEFEEEMLERSGAKVKDSAKAAKALHSVGVLREDNAPKGRLFTTEK